ncbi:MAG: SDR family oxidoreductase [Pseudomonadales bacterium]|nr:SDR family oxidoreductase [Pseudomonadales bacterium]
MFGGAGFLGSHLCEKLLSQGKKVICADNFDTGRMENIAHLCGKSAFQFIRHDVVAPLAVEVDEIYNLASPASPPHYQADSIRTLKTNLFGAFNVLELARARGIKVFQASTSEVYGDPEVHPQPESYWGNVNPIGPRACYDEGKRGAETMFACFRAQHGVDTRMARIFNTYGPRMRPDDGRVVSNFVMQALCGENITIYGDGQQTRSFCFVDDLIDGFVKLMDAPSSNGEPINLGNPGEFTMLELAELVIGLTGSRSKITYRPLPVDDPRQRRPDITRAKDKLGWMPRIPLAEGLVTTIDYFDRYLTQAAPRAHVG